MATRKRNDRVAMDSLRAPTPFLATPGRPQLPWNQWYCEFRIFAVATGWDTWSEERQEALLLYCVGQEARRLYFAAAKPAQTATEPAQSVTDVTRDAETVTVGTERVKRVNVCHYRKWTLCQKYSKNSSLRTRMYILRECYSVNVCRTVELQLCISLNFRLSVLSVRSVSCRSS